MARKTTDITGQKFNRLTAIKHIEGSFWLFKCDCGNEKIANKSEVKRGNIKSCGCYFKSKRKYSDKIIRTLSGMKQRCYNTTNHNYPKYGGRGITICNRWLESYQNFFEDMGEPPTPQHTIDRIDNNGNYEPSNCRWATQKEQNRNYSRNHLLTYNGKTQTIMEWSEEISIKYTTLKERIRVRKWSVEKALTTP